MLSLCEGCKPIKSPSANKKKRKDAKNDSIPSVVLKVSCVKYLLLKEKSPPTNNPLLVFWITHNLGARISSPWIQARKLDNATLCKRSH